MDAARLRYRLLGPVAVTASRAELFPFSDIDLLILTPGTGSSKKDDKAHQPIKEPLAMLLRDLWDKGLRISQSVHTPQDCNQIDNTNAELSVSLIDRRFLAGDEALFRQIRDPRAELGKDIARLTKERHAEFQGTIYHLEPNVKDAPGGLRDMQVLRWLAKLGAGDEQAPPDTTVLFEVRCFLHYLAGRDDNRFTFDRQDEIAKLIGASSAEELMRRYYRAVRSISRLANRRLERFEAKGSSLFSQFRDKTSRLSNSDFSVVRGEILFRSANAVEIDPGIVMRLFEFVAMHGAFRSRAILWTGWCGPAVTSRNGQKRSTICCRFCAARCYYPTQPRRCVCCMSARLWKEFSRSCGTWKPWSFAISITATRWMSTRLLPSQP